MLKTIHKKIIAIFMILAVLISVTLLCSCVSSNSEGWGKVETTYPKDQLELANLNNLYVITTPDFPPWEYIHDGSLDGGDIELAYIIADSLGLELNIATYDYDSIFNVLKNNKDFDLVINAVVKDKEKETIMDLSDPYYTGSAQMLLVSKKDANISETDIEPMLNSSQTKVASIKSSSFLPHFKGQYPNTSIVSVDSINSLLETLNTGQANFVLFDNETFDYLPNKDMYKVGKSYEMNEEYVIALKKNCPKLLQSVNEVLKARKEDGTIDQLIKKYEEIFINEMDNYFNYYDGSLRIL